MLQYAVGDAGDIYEKSPRSSSRVPFPLFPSDSIVIDYCASSCSGIRNRSACDRAIIDRVATLFPLHSKSDEILRFTINISAHDSS